MNLSSLRALAIDVAFRTHGVPATVTRPAPDNTPIVTSAVWQMALEEQRAVGTDFQRREPRRPMALPRNVLPTMPRGTFVVAPESVGGPTKNWRVDELDRPTQFGIWRVLVVPV